MRENLVDRDSLRRVLLEEASRQVLKIGGEVRGDLNLLVHQIVHEGDAVGIEERQTTDDHRKQRHSQRPDIGRVRVVGLIAVFLIRPVLARVRRFNGRVDSGREPSLEFNVSKM